MKKGNNKLHIEGILLEKKVAGKGVGKAGKWMKVEFLIGDKTGAEIPVTIMQSEKIVKTGELNKNYQALETVVKEYKSVAEVGRENADYVTIKNGSISKNVYKNKQGQLTEFVTFESRYISRISGDVIIDKSTLTVSGIVNKILPKAEGTELLVRFLIPDYSGALEYYDFQVTNPEAVAYFEENIEVGMSLEMDIDIDYRSVKEKVLIKRSFGGDRVEETTKTIHKLEITGVQELMGENEWDSDEVAIGILELEKRYEEKLNSEPKKVKSGTEATSFNAQKGSEVNDMDIPF